MAEQPYQSYVARGQGPHGLGENPSPRTPALSLIQPWPTGGIVLNNKRIENRVGWRSCKYRGPIWLHASATAGKAFHDCAEGLGDALLAQNRDEEWEAFRNEHLDIRTVNGAPRYIPHTSLPMGAIVGHAQIVDVITGEADFVAWWMSGAGAQARAERMAQRAWWFGGFALVLDEVIGIEPVPCKGALGLWKVPEEIEARAMTALEKARTACSA